MYKKHKYWNSTQSVTWYVELRILDTLYKLPKNLSELVKVICKFSYNTKYESTAKTWLKC